MSKTPRLSSENQAESARAWKLLIVRMAAEQGVSHRAIGRHLDIAWGRIQKYLDPEEPDHNLSVARAFALDAMLGGPIVGLVDAALEQIRQEQRQDEEPSDAADVQSAAADLAASAGATVAELLRAAKDGRIEPAERHRAAASLRALRRDVDDAADALDDEASAQPPVRVVGGGR